MMKTTRIVLPLLAACTFVLLLLIANSKRVRVQIKAFFSQSKTTMPVTQQLQDSVALLASLHALMRDLQVRDTDIKITKLYHTSHKQMNVKIARGQPLEVIIWSIQKLCEQSGYRVSDCFVNYNRMMCTIMIKGMNDVFNHLELTLNFSRQFLQNNAKIAVVIKDLFDVDNETANDILSFDKPLNVLLHPTEEKGRQFALEAKKNGKEVLVYIPFESSIKSPYIKSGSLVMIHYQEEKIRSIIQQITASVGGVSGYANLFESMVLKDSRVMNIVFNHLNRYKGYYLDTRQFTHGSLLAELAEKNRIRYAQVTFWIERSDDQALVRQTLQQCIVYAHRNGIAIVLIRAGENLKSVLDESALLLKTNGIELVRISDLFSSEVSEQSKGVTTFGIKE